MEPEEDRSKSAQNGAMIGSVKVVKSSSNDWIVRLRKGLRNDIRPFEEIYQEGMANVTYLA